MSYALHIWEKPTGQPWPTTVEEAIRLLHVLYDTQQEPNSKFVALTHKLTARYADITSPEAEELPDWELAWIDGPLDGLADSAAYGIGIRLARWQEVQPFVVEQALAMGLNVTDDLSGEVFLANGTTLGSRAASKVGQSPKVVPSDGGKPRARDLQPIIVKRLKPIMEKHGYKQQRTKTKFGCTFPNGWHTIAVWLEEPASGCQLKVAATSRFNAVTDLVASIVAPEKPREEISEWWTTIVGPQHWLDDLGGYDSGYNREYRVNSRSEIDGILTHLEGKLEARLFPTLEQYKTLEGFDALLNPDDVCKSMFFISHESGYTNIIAAFLAGNPRLEALCHEFASKAHDPKRNGHLLRCIEYVRSRRI